MSERIVSIAAMQAADRYTIETLGVPSLLLMSHAGHAVADAVLIHLADARENARVAVVAGGGNNGGDGLVAAAVLLARGLRVDVLLTRQQRSEDAEMCCQALVAQMPHPRLSVFEGAPEEAQIILGRCDLIVDALFGTGLSRPIVGVDQAWVEAINRSPAQVLAVDIASGIHGDSGEILGAAVQADWTLPIAASLRGQWCGDGEQHSGVMLPAADIGIPAQAWAYEIPDGWQLLSRRRLKELTPSSTKDAHKGTFGHLWMFAGSTGYTGAPKLAAGGASAAHAGCVSLICPDEVYPVLAVSLEEHMVHPQSAMREQVGWQQADALLAGPGWGRQQHEVLAELLELPIPLLLDADALNMLAESADLQQSLHRRTHPTVLTPHPGEAARLLAVTSENVQHDRFAAALELQQRFTCVVVLKGRHTLIVDDTRRCLCPFGSARLARGGSGDVLAGVCAALLARGMDAWEAACLASGWHALAGEQMNWFSMGELTRNISKLYDEFTDGI